MAALDNGWDVAVALSADAGMSLERRTHLSQLPINIHFIPAKREIAFQRQLHRYCRRAEATLLIMPDGDRASVLDARLSARSYLTRYVTIRSTSHPVKRLVIDAGRRARGRTGDTQIFKLVPSHRPAGPNEVSDPVAIAVSESANDGVRSLLAPAEGRFVFGILGNITARKCPGLLIQSLTATGRSRETAILLAGEVSDEAAKDIRDSRDGYERQGGRLIETYEMLSDFMLDGLIANVDCVALLHTNPGPSGILGKAQVLGTGRLASLHVESGEDPYLVKSSLAIDSVAPALVAAMEVDRPMPLQASSAQAFASTLLRAP